MSQEISASWKIKVKDEVYEIEVVGDNKEEVERIFSDLEKKYLKHSPPEHGEPITDTGKVDK